MVEVAVSQDCESQPGTPLKYGQAKCSHAQMAKNSILFFIINYVAKAKI